MRNFILAIIDFFYPPFKKYISLHNFRYLATGGGTFVLGLVVYYIAFYHLFPQTDEVNFLGIVLKRKTAALVVDYAVIIPVSWILNKYVIFTHSEVKSRVQLFRFANLQLINILANTVLFQFSTEILNIYPTVSRLLVGVLVAGFSYIYQHYFTFSVKKLKKSKR